MAESACLRRSFSNPSQIIHGIQEGDSTRALGESVSFGRYMSESLSWERWSAFSRNRYLEEAEKYSKPGSVAKMKAFFEAHYSIGGAKKRAAQEEANNDISGVEPQARNKIESSLSLNVGETLANCHVTICEIGAKRRTILEETNNESSEPKVQKTADLEPQSSSNVNNELDKEVHIEIQVHGCKDVQDKRGEFPEKVSQCMNVQKKIDIINHTPEKKLPVKEVEKKNSKINRKSADSPLKQHRRKTEDSPLKQCRGKTEDSPLKQCRQKTEDSPLKQCRRKTEDSPLKQSLKSNVSKLSASLARLSTPVRPKMEGRDTPDGRKLGKESVDKMKSASRTANVATNTDVKKTSSMSSRKAGIGKIFSPLGKIIRDRFTSPAPSKASRNSVVRHPCVTPQSEIKRSKVALEKSFCKSKTLDQNLKSPATGNMNSSVQSTSVYPFKLRTEERAAKRRELLQKRMEKEAENLQQPAKVKPETRKSSLGINLKASASTNIRTEVFSNDTKKIVSSSTPLPNRGSKPASDQKQATFSQTFHKTITSSKLGSEKSKQVSVESSSNLCSEKSERVSTEPTSKLHLDKSKPVSTQSSSKLGLEKSKPVSVQSTSKPDSRKSKLVSTQPSPKLRIEKCETVSTKSSTTMTPMKKRQENTSPNIL